MFDKFQTRLLRVNDKGEIHACAVCGAPVELIQSGSFEHWLISCNCGKYDLPQWCIIDAYNRQKLMRNYQPFRFPCEPKNADSEV